MGHLGDPAMRILHLVHQFLPDDIGGAELYTRGLAQASVQRGHRVGVFYRRRASGSGVARREDGAVTVWAAWHGTISPRERFLATFGDRAMVEAFGEVLDEMRPDLVHIEHLMGLPVDLVTMLRSRGIPYVITLWDYWWICANAQLLTNDGGLLCPGPRAYINCGRCALARVGHAAWWPFSPALAPLFCWRNRLLHQVLVDARWLLAPTEFVRHWYLAHGLRSDRVAIVQPGLADWPPVWSEGPTEHGQPVATEPNSRPLRFAYLGGLSWQKGVHVLIEAFSGITAPAELWIAGNEAFDPAYGVRLHGLATPTVQFLGQLDRERVWDVLAQVDVVVVPTLWYETFSFLVSEAFAAGLPVLASRLGPLADRVLDGVNGLLLPPGDVGAWRMALQALACQPAEVRRLTRGIRPPPGLSEHAAEVEHYYSQAV